MSNDNENTRRRLSSVAPIPMNNIFARAHCPPFPGPINTGAAQDRQRRMSASTFGLPSASPKASLYPYGDRRSSASSSIEPGSIDETAIEEDDITWNIPASPFARRMSMSAQAMRSVRLGSSLGDAGTGNLSLSEQFRARAESSVSQSQRPHFSGSPSYARNTSSVAPPTAGTVTAAVSQAPVRPRQKEPDAFQERILKGDFYID